MNAADITSAVNQVAKAFQKTGRRIQRQVSIFDRAHIKEGQKFTTSDHATYGVTKSGAFVRLNKDRRSPKERKRARRLAKLKQAA